MDPRNTFASTPMLNYQDKNGTRYQLSRQSLGLKPGRKASITVSEDALFHEYDKDYISKVEPTFYEKRGCLPRFYSFKTRPTLLPDVKHELQDMPDEGQVEDRIAAVLAYQTDPTVAQICGKQRTPTVLEELKAAIISRTKKEKLTIAPSEVLAGLSWKGIRVPESVMRVCEESKPVEKTIILQSLQQLIPVFREMESLEKRVSTTLVVSLLSRPRRISRTFEAEYKSHHLLNSVGKEIVVPFTYLLDNDYITMSTTLYEDQVYFLCLGFYFSDCSKNISYVGFDPLQEVSETFQVQLEVQTSPHEIMTKKINLILQTLNCSSGIAWDAPVLDVSLPLHPFSQQFKTQDGKVIPFPRCILVVKVVSAAGERRLIRQFPVEVNRKTQQQVSFLLGDICNLSYDSTKTSSALDAYLLHFQLLVNGCEPGDALLFSFELADDEALCQFVDGFKDFKPPKVHLLPNPDHGSKRGRRLDVYSSKQEAPFCYGTLTLFKTELSTRDRCVYSCHLIGGVPECGKDAALFLPDCPENMDAGSHVPWLVASCVSQDYKNHKEEELNVLPFYLYVQLNETPIRWHEDIGLYLSAKSTAVKRERLLRRLFQAVVRKESKALSEEVHGLVQRCLAGNGALSDQDAAAIDALKDETDFALALLSCREAVLAGASERLLYLLAAYAAPWTPLQLTDLLTLKAALLSTTPRQPGILRRTQAPFHLYNIIGLSSALLELDLAGRKVSGFSLDWSGLGPGIYATVESELKQLVGRLFAPRALEKHKQSALAALEASGFSPQLAGFSLQSGVSLESFLETLLVALRVCGNGVSRGFQPGESCRSLLGKAVLAGLSAVALLSDRVALEIVTEEFKLNSERLQNTAPVQRLLLSCVSGAFRIISVLDLREIVSPLFSILLENGADADSLCFTEICKHINLLEHVSPLKAGAVLELFAKRAEKDPTLHAQLVEIAAENAVVAEGLGLVGKANKRLVEELGTKAAFQRPVFMLGNEGVRSQDELDLTEAYFEEMLLQKTRDENLLLFLYKILAAHGRELAAVVIFLSSAVQRTEDAGDERVAELAASFLRKNEKLKNVTASLLCSYCRLAQADKETGARFLGFFEARNVQGYCVDILKEFASLSSALEEMQPSQREALLNDNNGIEDKQELLNFLLAHEQKLVRLMDLCIELQLPGAHIFADALVLVSLRVESSLAVQWLRFKNDLLLTLPDPFATLYFVQYVQKCEITPQQYEVVAHATSGSCIQCEKLWRLLLVQQIQLQQTREKGPWKAGEESAGDTLLKALLLPVPVLVQKISIPINVLELRRTSPWCIFDFRIPYYGVFHGRRAGAAFHDTRVTLEQSVLRTPISLDATDMESTMGVAGVCDLIRLALCSGAEALENFPGYLQLLNGQRHTGAKRRQTVAYKKLYRYLNIRPPNDDLDVVQYNRGNPIFENRELTWLLSDTGECVRIPECLNIAAPARRLVGPFLPCQGNEGSASIRLVFIIERQRSLRCTSCLGPEFSGQQAVDSLRKWALSEIELVKKQKTQKTQKKRFSYVLSDINWLKQCGFNDVLTAAEIAEIDAEISKPVRQLPKIAKLVTMASM